MGNWKPQCLIVTIAFSDDTGRNTGTKLYDRLTGSARRGFSGLCEGRCRSAAKQRAV